MENRENDTGFHKTGQQRYPRQYNLYMYKACSCMRMRSNNCNGCFVITAKFQHVLGGGGIRVH